MSGFVVNVIGTGADPALFSGLGRVAALSPGRAFDIAAPRGLETLKAAREIAGDAP